MRGGSRGLVRDTRDHSMSRGLEASVHVLTIETCCPACYWRVAQTLTRVFWANNTSVVSRQRGRRRMATRIHEVDITEVVKYDSE